jgi:hypothetical protein
MSNIMTENLEVPLHKSIKALIMQHTMGEKYEVFDMFSSNTPKF